MFQKADNQKRSSLHMTTNPPFLPPRAANSNKGDYGKIVVIGGSLGMSGAPTMASIAALRSGAGLVRTIVPHSIQPIVAAANLCLMTAGEEQDADGRFAEAAFDAWMRHAEWADVVAVGPGLGRSDALQSLAKRFLIACERPIVLDADGLNACGEQPAWLADRKAPTILTPHPGEFARLTGLLIADVQSRRQELAEQFAQQHQGVVVLKGDATFVTDGTQTFVNDTGNPGMATGGTGDVLTGVIAAMLGQGLAPFDAAQLGVHLHGFAGDRAADRVGEVGMIATDLLDEIPLAIRHSPWRGR
ncbi:MAG: NAD(P)H-hydrate dehydratase [Gemmataceae bacterium]|nr:NAD(P)H-hydrate dehydratase [Gemmataceae bacterium]